MASESNLPAWTEELRRRYLAGEAVQFVLHGNVNDVVVVGDEFVRLSDFLCRVVLAPSKQVVVHYNVAIGVRFEKKRAEVPDLDVLALARSPEQVLPALEQLLQQNDKVALLVDYAEMVAPSGDSTFFSSADRQSVVALHRWSYSPALERADSVIVLVVENLSELNPKLVNNPTTAAIKIPMPDAAARREAVRRVRPDLPPAALDRLAELSAGLKLVQLKTLLAVTEGAADADETVTTRVLERKREIIERECYGLVEFVTPRHDFSAVGGIDAVKQELLAIAEHLRAGRSERCPMGLLFTGPMGTGKTFVAEAFVKSSGLTAIKLKNFRSKWVGATEGNLERILTVVQAIGQVIVIIDEGDRAFGGGDEEDGGTSSRVMARLKEFMSDTTNRGRVLFVIMTNRPDKLDIDLKRAGRLDRKIPFFYPQTAPDVEAVLAAQLRRHRVDTELQFPRDRAAVSEPLIGYSNAELEGVLLLANDYAASARVTLAHFAEAMRDYLPSRDVEMLEYQELAAVFEASNRRLLPPKYANETAEALRQKLAVLRARLGGRR
jgi:ATP-dependent 26S proteasome regulatory subunit